MFVPRNTYPTGTDSDLAAFREGLSKAEALCKEVPTYPHIMAGIEMFGLDDDTYVTVDPNDPTCVLARFPVHNLTYAGEHQRLFSSVSLIRSAQARWQKVRWQDRVKVVRALSQIVNDQMWLLVGLMALEGGKRPFPNGIGEVMEAIDFCENALCLAEQLFTEKSPTAPEFMCDFNGWLFTAKGVIVDIEPFNFALAIPMEKIVNAIITGNAIVMKASGHTPLQGYTLYRIVEQAFYQAGFKNDGIVNFISGHGGDLATFFLEHPDVDGFTFTGSKAAYWDIQKKSAELHKKGGGRLQEIAAETSGCNAMIVAADANIENAVNATCESLINNNGQTCSHLGHLILDRSIADEFMPKLRNALEALHYGDVKDPHNHCGALISLDAGRRNEETIATLIKQGWVDLIYKKTIEGRGASDFAPRILVVRPGILINLEIVQELRSTEIFGMALILWIVDTREEARKIFESGIFALTGGLFTSDPDYALDFAVNYRGAAQKYINMRITGATVGMAFGGLATSASSGDGTGAGTLQALGKYVSHVNVAVKSPSPADTSRWHELFAKDMSLAP